LFLSGLTYDSQILERDGNGHRYIYGQGFDKKTKTFFAFVSVRVGEGSEPRFPAGVALLGTGIARAPREANIVWGANEPNKPAEGVVRGWGGAARNIDWFSGLGGTMLRGRQTVNGVHSECGRNF